MGWAGGSGPKHFSRSRTGQTVAILDLPYGDISSTTVSHPPLPNQKPRYDQHCQWCARDPTTSLELDIPPVRGSVSGPRRLAGAVSPCSTLSGASARGKSMKRGSILRITALLGLFGFLLTGISVPISSSSAAAANERYVGEWAGRVHLGRGGPCTSSDTNVVRCTSNPVEGRAYHVWCVGAGEATVSTPEPRPAGSMAAVPCEDKPAPGELPFSSISGTSEAEFDLFPDAPGGFQGTCAHVPGVQCRTRGDNNHKFYVKCTMGGPGATMTTDITITAYRACRSQRTRRGHFQLHSPVHRLIGYLRPIQG